MWLGLLALACRPKPGPLDPGPNPTTTEDVPTAPVVEATCQRDSNPLRVRCAASVAYEGAAVLELGATGEADRVFRSNVNALSHEIVGWGLVPDTTYRWRIGEHTGEVTTGGLPPPLAEAQIEVSGTPFGFDAVLHPLDCGEAAYFTLVDGDGRIVWYEPDDVFHRGSMTGYDWSAQGRSVLAVNAFTFLEVTAWGDSLIRLDRPGDFEYPLHHDVARWGRYRYLLFERQIGEAWVDGFYVFDGDQRVATWFMEDHFDVPRDARGKWGHVNGIRVTTSGEVVLSVLNFDSVVVVDGNPASEGFLEVLWHAAGNREGGLPDPDLVALDGPEEGFSRQHHATLLDDTLWVFDNAGQPTSRALRLQLDSDDGTMAQTGAWSFGTRCRLQGGAVPIEGGVLATCANDGLVWAFEDAGETPAWTLRMQCGSKLPLLPLTRGIPVLIE